MADIIDKGDLDIIKRVMLGGAALGGGTALVTSLMNYLKKLNESKTDGDDDTLYVRQTSPVVKSASLGGGLALAGGALTTAGTYALIKKIYNSIMKAEAQRELDEAQKVYLETQGYTPVEKKAGFRNMNLGELFTSLPVAVPLLVALGGAAGAYKLLDKQFPRKVKKPTPPKRIEVIDEPAVTEDEEIYENEKAASFMESDCMELISHLISAPGSSVVSDAANLVHAVAGGGLGEFKKAADAIGFVPSLGLVKGAAAHEVDPMKKQFALTYLTKSARFSAPFGVVLAGEFAEKYPTFFKQAASMDENTRESLYKIACILGNAIRAEHAMEMGIIMPEGEEVMSKKAFLDTLGEDAAVMALEKLLTSKNGEILPNANDADSSESTDTSGEETGENNSSDNPSRQSAASKIKYISSAKSTKGFLDKLGTDEIDQVLQANR